MGATKEYFLKLQEQTYNDLPSDEKIYLNRLGLECRQLPDDEFLKDENYLKIKKNRVDAWQKEQEYIFKKRNNII